MPSQEEFDELKGRIVELENRLRQRGSGRGISSITPEEMQAFAKVRDILAGDWGEFCGPYDCYRCIQRCWQPCIFDCSCGPCLAGGPEVDGVGRFGNLGS